MSNVFFFPIPHIPLNLHSTREGHCVWKIAKDYVKKCENVLCAAFKSVKVPLYKKHGGSQKKKI